MTRNEAVKKHIGDKCNDIIAYVDKRIEESMLQFEPYIYISDKDIMRVIKDDNKEKIDTILKYLEFHYDERGYYCSCDLEHEHLLTIAWFLL